ncbi:MAG: group III truncated hemoglobin [Ferruginibacter sp.]
MSNRKPDIETRTDIELLVNNFYEKVIADKELKLIFNDSYSASWPPPLLLMYDFWENIILFTGTYDGVPMHLHKNMHFIFPIAEVHFTRWNQLFLDTVNSIFEGKNATLAKTRAISISDIFKEKILKQRRDDNEKFINLN